jgi:hypothetical protein
VVSDLTLEAHGEVPAGATSQRFRSETRLADDTYVIALRPEISPGVKSIEVSARKPDGGTEVLLFAKDFPADWPSPYILKTPLAIPRGSRLSATAYWGNDGGIAQPGGFRLTISGYRNADPRR